MPTGRFLSFLFALAVLSGCSAYQPTPVAHHSSLVAPYRLDSGDELRVIVFGQDNLTNTYSIDQAGQISMPLIGEVEARNLTTIQLEDRIAKRLRGGYLINPDVSVEVSRYRPFFAMGEVNAGGQYSYVAGMTVQSAVAVAGGFGPRADRKTVDVTRNQGGQLETVRLKMTDPVRPGDTIYVRERVF